MNMSAFPIVGIGASAGGIDAFHSFFNHMPANCGMAFIILLHLPADRKSMLTDILARWTSMRVLDGVDGALIEPNCVYVPPPHSLVTLSDDHLGVQLPPETNDRLFRPIDGFFDSLGSALRERAVGIVLSGTGSDGALGLKAIKECGGLTLAQGTDGSAPQYREMPAGAIATGAVDLVVPVEEMPRHLMRLQANGTAGAEQAKDGNRLEAARLEICAILREALGHDFSGYRPQTFMRRVDRRMQVLNLASLQVYVERLKSDHAEVRLLFRDLLIRVTSFFGMRRLLKRSRRKSFRNYLKSRKRIVPCACGFLDAPQGRKPIRSRSCCASTWTSSKAPQKSNCLRQISMILPSPPRDLAVTRPHCSMGSRSNVASAFSPILRVAMPSARRFATFAPSRRTAWCAIRPSHAWIWSPAAIS